MQPDRSDQTRQRMQQAKLLSREVRGERLNLGKKISVPVDLMMEELNLPSNRGSRMFQERQRRVERFTLENNVNNNNVNNNDNVNNVNGYDYSGFPELDRSAQNLPDPQPENQENQTFHPVPGKYSLVTSLQKTVAKKGSPDVIAPGYSGPLKEIPHEKFNTTVIPKSYCSPWREALGDQPAAAASLTALTSQLPELPHQLQPANYRCFNRAAMPFGGPMASRRVVPVSGLEVLERGPRLPCVTLERLTQRPNFNRAPRGWGHQYAPESSNL